MNALDFFCGGGGITCGLLDAGIDVIAGIDANPLCQQTYEANNHVPYLCEDIQRVTGDMLRERYPDVLENDELLMVGCAPCQPFSLLQKGNPNQHASVNLLNEFGRLVQDLLPAHIMVENVPGLRGRGGEVLQEFLAMLRDNGYQYDSSVVNAKNYGIPQNRRRFVLIASRFFEPHIPEATHGQDLLEYTTVANAIAHFPALNAGGIDPNVPNHRAANLQEITMNRMLATPHDGGGRLNWPLELQLNCHANFQGHSDVYGRMSWNAVSPTLTAKCYSISNGRFGHPEQNRAISLREAAAIQTFPDNYVFYGSMQEIGRQIGNAVPVLLSSVLAQYILEEHEQNH